MEEADLKELDEWLMRLYEAETEAIAKAILAQCRVLLRGVEATRQVARESSTSGA